MSAAMRFEQMYLIKDAAGNLLWQGAALILNAIEATSAEASNTVGVGEAVRLDNTTSVIPRWDYANTGTDVPAPGVVKVLRVSAAANTGFIGVALEPIAPGKQGRIAPVGTITCVKCINPPTSNTLGAAITGSATAGSVDAPLAANAVSTATGIPAGGTMLGRVIQAAGTSANQTGSLTQLGVLVVPA